MSILKQSLRYDNEKYFEIAEKRLNECIETTIFDK